MRRVPLIASALLIVACTDNPIAPKQALRVDPSGGHRQITNAVWEKSSTGIDVVPIGQFNGQYTMLVDINDNGLAVGWGYTPDGQSERAISWQNGVFTDLGTLGGNFSRAHQVNNAGVIVGESQDATGRYSPVVWENGVIRELPRLSPWNPYGSGIAQSINERGDIVGNQFDDISGNSGALWPAGGGVVNLGKLPGADFSWATGINRDGTIIGQSLYFVSPTVGYSSRANMWTGGTLSEISLPSGSAIVGSDIATGQMFNDAGDFLAEIAGSIQFYFGRAMVFRNGAFETLATLPNASQPFARTYGLNEAGDVVGISFGQFNFSPVLWSHDGSLIDLGVPRGGPAADAHGINNRGLIVGQAQVQWTPGGFYGGGAVLWRVSAPDVTPPTISYSAHAADYTVDAHVSITCTASDAESGIASNTCAPIDGDAYVFGLGPHAYSATATDNAGNTATASTTFTVSVTFASLTNLTRRFVTNKGVADDLAGDLAQAQQARENGKTKQADAKLKDYRATLQAQTGKSITAERAAVLIGLSQSV
jgi:probable HAF family extracellular repeat protein